MVRESSTCSRRIPGNLVLDLVPETHSVSVLSMSPHMSWLVKYRYVASDTLYKQKRGKKNLLGHELVILCQIVVIGKIWYMS